MRIFSAAPLALVAWGAFALSAAFAQEPASRPRLGFVGLHGGVFEVLQGFEDALGIDVEYITDEEILDGAPDFSRYRLVFLQHLRDEAKGRYEALFREARAARPEQRVLDISGGAANRIPKLLEEGIVIHDPKLAEYYSSQSPENLRRMLGYALVTHGGRAGTAEPPLDGPSGVLFHPDHEGLFEGVAEFRAWSRGRGAADEMRPRVLVAAHYVHLMMQQPAVVEALVRAFEAQGFEAAAVVDSADGPRPPSGETRQEIYERALFEYAPHVVVHTCHTRDEPELWMRLGVPHTQSIFFRRVSIAEFEGGAAALTPHEVVFQVVTQELRGGIEPQIGAGTKLGGGSSEAFTPIPERIDHLVRRTAAWARLATEPEDRKRVAFLYYDREMGQSELMRGSATGMFLNAPRSLVRLLDRMRDAGYRIDPLPRDEDELLAWMQDHGRQIGVWAPGVLDRLARSGKAVLIPVDRYRAWFEAKVPPAQQRQVVERWGEAPGRFLVWKDSAGTEFLVVPRVDLGNVVLLPQPLRGEAHDSSLVHDAETAPPHNYLATYFWLQEEFGADALVHFGTHGTEFLLPGRGVGLGAGDWPDVVLGDLPNLNPWVINNLGESSPARRRASSLLIGHMTPASVAGGLSDELRNLHDDVHKWETLEEGALREKFRLAATTAVREQGLDRDLHLEWSADSQLDDEQMRRLAEYLHQLEQEAIPVDLHVLGEPMREDLQVPFLATCLGSGFQRALAALLPGRPEEPSIQRAFVERAVTLRVRQQLEAAEVLVALGGDPAVLGTDEKDAVRFRDGMERLPELVAGLRGVTDEVENFLAALDGRFVPPGPGGSPDRNPAALPTGRNLYVMNPEEIPARASWELGSQLAESLLADRLASNGRYPERVAFSLSSSGTFQDYGVLESQVLALIGARPIWDHRNLVQDVEILSTEELGRPRIDVFLAGQGYYRDTLPSRMVLLDRAFRRVAELVDESDEQNFVRKHTLAIRQELRAEGVEASRARALAAARIFGGPPEVSGSAGYYYLVERSGDWETREDLMKVYLEHSTWAYTEELWGVPAESAYRRQLADSEIVVRSWSDRTRSPTSNKYFWFRGGSLAQAIEHLSGRRPEFLLADLRDPDDARMVSAEDALRTDFRARLFNRRWIEGLMREGYAGADQIAVHVSNAFGWEVMREGSVGDDVWEEIVEVYVRDSKGLGLREWFESENPFALQEVAEILLESARKGFWDADQATLSEVAEVHARSVARHGENGGLRGAGNTALEEFVDRLLGAARLADAEELLAQVEQRRAEAAAAREPAEPGEERRVVTGEVLVPRAETPPAPPAPPRPSWWLLGGLAGLVLLGLGYAGRSGAPR